MSSPTIEDLFHDLSNQNSGTFSTAGTNRLAVFVVLSSTNTASQALTYGIDASGLTFKRVFHHQFPANGTGQTNIDVFTAPCAAQVTSLAWSSERLGNTGSYSALITYAFAIAGLHDINAPFDSNALSLAFASQTVGGASAPNVPVTTSQADDLLVNIILNAGSFTTPTVTSGWTVSPLAGDPSGNLASGATEYDLLIQSKAVSSTQSAATITAAYSDSFWFDLVLSFTGDAGGTQYPNGGGYVPKPIVTAGTPGAATNTANNTITCTYTTDAVDEIILLYFNGQTGANALTAVQVSTVNDTNSLVWAKRTQKISGSMTVPGGHTPCLDTAEVWWAHAPTAVSGTITLVTNLTPDNMCIAAQPFANVGSMTAPFDTDGSIPASSENDTGTGSVATETINTGTQGYVFGVWGSAAGGNIGANTDWTLIVNENTSSGANWCRLNVVGITTFDPQSSFTVAGTGSETSWVFIADALAGDTGLPAGSTWMSIETPDSMVIIVQNGPPGVVGDLNALETIDLLAAVGFVASVGVIAVAETPDTFNGLLTRPTTGALAVTETRDVFAAVGVGFGENLSMTITELLDIAHFLVDAVQPTHGVLAATETPDRFLALGAGAVAPTSQNIVFFVA